MFNNRTINFGQQINNKTFDGVSSRWRHGTSDTWNYKPK